MNLPCCLVQVGEAEGAAGPSFLASGEGEAEGAAPSVPASGEGEEEGAAGPSLRPSELPPSPLHCPLFQTKFCLAWEGQSPSQASPEHRHDAGRFLE